MRTEFTPVEVDTLKDADIRSSHERRKYRYKLRGQAAKILPNERVAGCGQRMTGPLVTVCKGEHGPYFAGVQTCGSVWHCPVCAAKISEGRRREIETVLAAHQAEGGNQFLVTFTMSHRASDMCSELNSIVRLVWKKLISGTAWQRLRERYNLNFVKALEVTYGSHGWHPHIHVIMCTNALSPLEQKRLHKWLRARWIRIVNQVKEWPNKKAAFRHAVDFRQCDTVGKAGDYITKSGISYELTKSNHKTGKSSSKSPWQLLISALKGDDKAARVFREYGQAFKGTRQLTWSKGFRDQYLNDADQSDEEIAIRLCAYGGDQVIATIPKRIWKEIVCFQLQDRLLASVEQNEIWSLTRFLRENSNLCVKVLLNNTG